MKLFKKKPAILSIIAASVMIAGAVGGCSNISMLSENQSPKHEAHMEKKEQTEEETRTSVNEEITPNKRGNSSKGEAHAAENDQEKSASLDADDYDIKALEKHIDNEEAESGSSVDPNLGPAAKESEEQKEKKKEDLLKRKADFEARTAYSAEKYGPELDPNKPHKIPILIFHEIRRGYNGNISVIISEDTFKEYMLYLKALKFQPITFQDYFEYQKGNKKIAENSVLITFDDGYCSNYKLAYPMMEKLGFKGTISVIGRYLDNSKPGDWGTKSLSFITWDYAKEMADSGVIDIQAHTYDLHYEGTDNQHSRGVMGLNGEDELRREGRIAEDDIKFQQEIKRKIGHEANIFTYPFGFSDDFTDYVYKKRNYVYRLGVTKGISDLKDPSKPLMRINTPVNETPSKVMKDMLTLMGKDSTLPCEGVANQKERIKKLEELTGVSLEEF